MGFERMSRGWVKGTKDFKRAVLDDLNDEQIQRVVEAEASEMREPRWEGTLREALCVINHEAKDLLSGPKGQGWKVDLARYLREAHLAPYRWIAENLHMGAPSYVQSLVSRHRKKIASDKWNSLQKHGKLGSLPLLRHALTGGIYRANGWLILTTTILKGLSPNLSLCRLVQCRQLFGVGFLSSRKL